MNIILFDSSDYENTKKIVLRDRRFEHIRNVLKSKVGDTLRLGLINGSMGDGIIEYIDEEKVDISLTLNQPPPSKLPLTLVCALPRPKTMNRILRYGSSCGVKQFIFIESWKVEKAYWQSPMLATENIRRQLLLGLEQSQDTVLPQVSFHRRFRIFAEDLLPELSKGALKLTAHPHGREFSHAPSGGQRICLALGPEGGFTDFEIEKFAECGFECVSFSLRILRCEVALPYIIGKLF